MGEITAESPLMQRVEWDGTTYYTSQFFHRQYMTDSRYQGKHKEHANFLRVIRAIPAYHLYITKRNIVELQWNEIKSMKSEVHQNLMDFITPLFKAVGYRSLVLLDAVAQIALVQQLEDDMSKKMSVTANTLAARQMQAPTPMTLTPELAAIVAQIASKAAAEFFDVGLEKRLPVHLAPLERRLTVIEETHPQLLQLTAEVASLRTAVAARDEQIGLLKDRLEQYVPPRGWKTAYEWVQGVVGEDQSVVAHMARRSINGFDDLHWFSSTAIALMLERHLIADHDGATFVAEHRNVKRVFMPYAIFCLVLAKFKEIKYPQRVLRMTPLRMAPPAPPT